MSKFLDLIASINKYDAITKKSFVRKLPNGKYRVLSEKGKNLGTFDSREQAEKHLREVEYFKHKKKASVKDIIDLSSIKELSYSAVMRELRQYDDNGVSKIFLSIFKKIFDELVNNEIENPADKALPITLIIFSKIYPVKLTDTHD